MRIIIFSRRQAVRRLVVWLSEQGNEVVLSDKPAGISELGGESAFDLGIVDDLYPGAVVACHHIKKKWNIPLILIVSKRLSGWKSTWLLNSDGHIPGNAGDFEAKAHLGLLLKRLYLRKMYVTPRNGDGSRIGDAVGQGNDTPDLTVAEVAELLNIHTSTVIKWSKKGILPSSQNQQNGMRFSQKDIYTFLGVYSKNKQK